MYLFFNGTYQPVSRPLFTAANRAYRYGEGLFETMLFRNGQLQFAKEHILRLQEGIALLGINPPAGFGQSLIETTVAELLEKNNHLPAARIRLSVTAGDGLLHQINPAGFEWLLESFPHPQLTGSAQNNGITLGLFPTVQKNTGALSGVKTASHLVYALAARYAQQHGLNDCVVLNTNGAVCDTSIANIFMLKQGILVTPPLNSGCIAGIMRKKLLEWCAQQQIPVQERPVLPEELLLADELFTTNVIKGICPVARYEGREYECSFVHAMAAQFMAE